MKTLVLGASDKSSRYSCLAIHKLLQKNHEVAAIGKRKSKVENVQIETEKSLFDDVDTITIYLNAQNQREYYDYIFSLKPCRIIFNPGAENPELFQLAEKKSIKAIEACTLVMLSTGQF